MRGVHRDIFPAKTDDPYDGEVDTRHSVIAYIPEAGAMTPFRPSITARD